MDAAPDSVKSGNGYSWKTLFRVSEIVGESTPEVSPEQRAIEAKKSELLARKMKDEYYALRGWDPKTGVPTAEKLAELRLAT